MAKKVAGYIKLQVPAGQANPAPPVGPALGQHGVNIMEFCKAFNAETQGVEPGLPIPVVITVYSGSQLHVHLQDPARSRAAAQGGRPEEGSGTPNTEQGRQGQSCKQLEEIATTKMPDLTAADMDAAVRTIAGTARSMGIEVEGALV